jgi:hypothetical protein
VNAVPPAEPRDQETGLPLPEQRVADLADLAGPAMSEAGAAPGTPPALPEGWYPCPTGEPVLRYWTGSSWTEQTRPDLIGWVHGPRIVDVPGVFAYGRPTGGAAGARPAPLDRRIVARARNDALFYLLLCAIYPLASKVLADLPLPTALDPLLWFVGLAVLLGWHGRWAVVGQHLWRRYRAAPQPAPAAPTSRPEPWPELRAAGFDAAARRLDADVTSGVLTDVDYVRISRELRAVRRDPNRLAAAAAAIEQSGAATWLHPSGQHDLPARVTQHDLVTGQVRLGTIAASPKNPPRQRGLWFALDTEVLRTSMLVIGPPGAGKTRGFARPIVELVGLQTLVNMASVVVIDTGGSDLDAPGSYDVDIDPNKPDAPWGFDLFGAANSPEEAADRLAGALLPDDEPGADAARNALDAALGAYHSVHGHYPTLRDLIDLLAEPDALRELRGAAGPRADDDADLRRRLTVRERQLASGPQDPAAAVVERLRLLDRPALVELFDGRPRKFAMRDLDRPQRVRIAVPEGSYPQAARIMARLVIGQFVQVVASPAANRDVFKGLIVDGAGRFVDAYAVQGLQRARAANAGMVLLAQSMREFPEQLRPTIFANAGCKAVFAGTDPQDATYFADWWGKNWVPETTVTTGTAHTAELTAAKARSDARLRSLTGHESITYQRSVATRAVERYAWSPSEVINAIPVGHALVSLATPDGIRTGPVLVNLRG